MSPGCYSHNLNPPLKISFQIFCRAVVFGSSRIFNQTLLFRAFGGVDFRFHADMNGLALNIAPAVRASDAEFYFLNLGNPFAAIAMKRGGSSYDVKVKIRIGLRVKMVYRLRGMGNQNIAVRQRHRVSENSAGRKTFVLDTVDEPGHPLS